MRSRNVEYLPAVDHLRAFASVLIVLYHAAHLIGGRLAPGGKGGGWPRAGDPLQAFVLEGHTAVALFLVLSGFIFTYAALGREIRYAGFLRNRLLRIYPLFLVLVLAGLAVHPDAFALGPLLQTLLALSNYPGHLDLGSFSAMFWTIGIEFQFYLVFPLLLAMANRGGAAPLLRVGAALLALRALAAALGGDVHHLSYWTLFGRLDQFLLGMLAAMHYRSGRWRPEVWRPLLAAFALALAGVLVAFHELGGWPAKAAWKAGWPTVEAGLWAGFLLGWLAVADRLPGVVSRALAAVGMVSYSTYLLHVVLVDLLVRHGFLVPVPALGGPAAGIVNGVVLVLPLVLGFATLTWFGIEKPFLALRVRYLGPRPPA